MKIIKPLTLDKTNTSSNAPLDVYPVWSPVGVDFATDISFSNFRMTAVGDTFVIADNSYSALNNDSLRVFNLSTLTFSAHSISYTTRPDYISISPNGQYLAVVQYTNSTFHSLNIFDLSSGANLHSDYLYTRYVSPANHWVADEVVWSLDSSWVAYVGWIGGSGFITNNACLRTFSTSTWTLLNESDKIIDLLDSSYYAFYIDAIETISNTALVFAIASRSSYDDRVETRLVSVEVTTGITLINSLKYENNTTSNIAYVPRINYIGYNPEQSRLLCGRYGNLSSEGHGLLSLSATTLATDGTPPAGFGTDRWVSGIYFAPGAGNEVLIKGDAAPYFARFAATNYAALTDIPHVDAFDYIYSDDYYCGSLATGGFNLVDRSDDSEVTQTNSTIPEDAIYTYIDNIYQALTETTDRPDLGAGTTWLDLGSSNPYRLFDGKLTTLTTAGTDLEVTITPNSLFSGLALFNLTAETVRVQVYDPVDEVDYVYDSGVISLAETSEIVDYFEYFFTPLTYKKDYVFIDLPPYPLGVIMVTLSGISGVSVGQIVVGPTRVLGDSQMGSKFGMLDFSKKERDEFGNFNIVERGFSKTGEYSVVFDTNIFSNIHKFLSFSRTEPIVWVGDENIEATIIYGFYNDFDLIYQGLGYCNGVITVEGLDGG